MLTFEQSCQSKASTTVAVKKYYSSTGVLRENRAFWTKEITSRMLHFGLAAEKPTLRRAAEAAALSNKGFFSASVPAVLPPKHRRPLKVG